MSVTIWVAFIWVFLAGMWVGWMIEITGSLWVEYYQDGSDCTWQGTILFCLGTFLVYFAAAAMSPVLTLMQLTTLSYTVLRRMVNRSS